jgi:hypothetical protein
MMMTTTFTVPAVAREAYAGAGRDAYTAAEANIAPIYVGLGDRDQAMIWLNKGYEA